MAQPLRETMVRSKRYTIVLLILMDMALGCLWLNTNTPLLTRPAAAATTPIQIKRLLRLEPDGIATCAVLPPGGSRKGLLCGWWFCQASSARGIQCRITAPDDTIARAYDHAPSGSFTLQFTGPGGYRFAFCDAGHAVPNERQIEIIANYLPQ